ncbi:hypothetical protein FNF29_01612 [Cafeteria roenbergensis]|uniref:Uncharacterized protein n=1 Tax=Cafeteria roenbergensis TaxID=33653 RepID=A0A5A8CT99_CAFRO|nr:hypothetical protein FNF29_01612 [Cafeteria roenbergensis]|eukprot:KAA0155697.1 hypothetical protein FNF29_01612 [Cafeteria roenbergensis]
MFDSRPVKENPRARATEDAYRRVRAFAAGALALGALLAVAASRMGFDSQARDPVCMASHAPEEAPALNSTGPGGREAPLMELVLTARAVEDAPWAAVAGLRPFLVLHQEGALRLCVGVGGLPAPASPFSDSTDDDDHAALAELALTMERLACDPRAPRRRFVFDLDCSGAVGRIGAGDEEGDPPTGAELEAALARLDEEPEADDEDADAESDQGQPLSPEELLRRRSDVVSDAWDGATVAVRAFGRLGLSFALADVSDALERGTDPGDVVSLLYAEGALTDSAADADDLRSESALPTSEFPLVSAPPAFSDRWLGMEGQLLALPDVGFYSPLRSHGFVDVGRVAAECSSLEAGSVKALIRARMNGLVLLQHDLEDLTTYSLLGQELERAGVPGPRQPGDAEPSMALGWGALLNATPTSLRVSTSLTAGDFLLSAQTSPLLDPAQWRRAAATLSPSRANAKLGGFGAASAAGAGPAARAADAAAAAAMSLLPGASRLAMRRSALAELDLFGQARGWSAALCFTRQWGRRLLSAAAAGATGVVASGPWSPAATWPSSAGRGPGDAPGPSLLRNVSAAARGSASSDVAWAGRWSDMDPFQPSAANGFASVVASANMRLLRDLSMALPMSDAPLSPPSALSQVDVDALVVASARRAAAAAAGACNADAGAALLLASEAAWESMESAGGSAGSGAARSYFALRWAMLPNTNEQAWAALVRTPWKDLVQATGRGAQASRRLGAAADAVDPSCGRAFSASREDGARALVRSAAVTQLYQGTWACLLEASWWLRTARVVAMAQGEDALSSQLPLPQGLGGRAADGEEGDDGSADAPDEEEDAVGSCLTWPWPRGMAEARVPEERLQLPSQEARTGGVGPQAQRHRPTDRACAEASRLLSAARAAVGHWRKRFPELGRRWQITGPDPDLDARPLFWRDTEPMSPRSVAELLNGPLRWRWQALCRKASAETGRA